MFFKVPPKLNLHNFSLNRINTVLVYSYDENICMKFIEMEILFVWNEILLAKIYDYDILMGGFKNDKQN